MNVQLSTSSEDGSILHNQFYYSRYEFELYFDFTFFLNNPVQGDHIKQKEKRNLLGYNGRYTRMDN